jgi:hypothetical protein
MMPQLTVLVPLTLLAGCAATVSPIEVTRFHQPGDVARNSFVAAAGQDTLEASTYQNAAARELTRLGFNPTPEQNAFYSYSVDVTRNERARAPKRSPVTIGLGGGTGGYGGGIGLGASFGLGGDRSRETIVTRLFIQIKRRSDQIVIWEGRAETDTPSNSPSAQSGPTADKLISALFKDFPGESGRTITVP